MASFIVLGHIMPILLTRLDLAGLCMFSEIHDFIMLNTSGLWNVDSKLMQPFGNLLMHYGKAIALWLHHGKEMLLGCFIETFVGTMHYFSISTKMKCCINYSLNGCSNVDEIMQCTLGYASCIPGKPSIYRVKLPICRMFAWQLWPMLWGWGKCICWLL